MNEIRDVLENVFFEAPKKPKVDAAPDTVLVNQGGIINSVKKSLNIDDADVIIKPTNKRINVIISTDDDKKEVLNSIKSSLEKEKLTSSLNVTINDKDGKLIANLPHENGTSLVFQIKKFGADNIPNDIVVNIINMVQSQNKNVRPKSDSKTGFVAMTSDSNGSGSSEATYDPSDGIVLIKYYVDKENMRETSARDLMSLLNTQEVKNIANPYAYKVERIHGNKGCQIKFNKSSKIIRFLSKPRSATSGITNIGNVAEGILACAITDRLEKYKITDLVNKSNKSADATVKDTIGIIERVKNLYSNTDKTLSQPEKKGSKKNNVVNVPPLIINGDDSISDTIKLNISLGRVSLLDLFDNYRMIPDIIHNAVRYANSERIDNFVKDIVNEFNPGGEITNEIIKPKSIEVNATGANEGNISKVDLRIIIVGRDGNEITKRLQISLKTSSKQLGQHASESKDFVNMFKGLFGDITNISSYMGEWDEMIAQRTNLRKDPKAYIKLRPMVSVVSNKIYKQVITEVDSYIKSINNDAGKKKNFIKTLARGVGYAALGSDYDTAMATDKDGKPKSNIQKIIVVSLTGGDEFEELDFYNIEKSLMDKSAEGLRFFIRYGKESNEDELSGQKNVKSEKNFKSIVDKVEKENPLPSIVVGLENDKVKMNLIRIRCKMERSSGRIIHYVFKEHGISELIKYQDDIKDVKASGGSDAAAAKFAASNVTHNTVMNNSVDMRSVMIKRLFG